ncbi:MAG: hypothetical protein ACREUX_04550 [Burkholderiales bacterium]
MIVFEGVHLLESSSRGAADSFAAGSRCYSASEKKETALRDRRMRSVAVPLDGRLIDVPVDEWAIVAKLEDSI